MLQYVVVGERPLAAYRGVAPDAVLDELARRARSLRGARVLHVNATAYGGGVSELLRSTIPLLNDLGLVADWKIIAGEEAFFRVTKTIHNALQGGPQGLSAVDRETYRATLARNARSFEEEYDFVFVHDPQPAGLLSLRGKGAARWVWRCHIDTASPQPEVWDFVRGYLTDYDAAVFTMDEFVPADLPISRCEIVPPAIDPLSPKNLHLGDDTARRVLEWIGVRLDKPLVVQVSRFDPWKDPLGVIAAYRRVREAIPEVRLALVGSMATDDPEGWEIYREVAAARAADPQLHVFTNLTGVGNIEVNAFQRHADVVVQKSLREGFGLVVSEALWKETPVVAGRSGGIPLQMADGAGGLLVDDVDGCAQAILTLLRDRARAADLARAGRARVREHFLIPRLLLNELQLMETLAQQLPIQGPAVFDEQRDPVCGMAIAEPAGDLTTVHEGRRYAFCSATCRSRFRDAPARFLARPLGAAGGGPEDAGS